MIEKSGLDPADIEVQAALGHLLTAIAARLVVSEQLVEQGRYNQARACLARLLKVFPKPNDGQVHRAWLEVDQ